MKYIILGLLIMCAYIFIALMIGKFCGSNTRMEEKLNSDDRSDSN